jgi:ribose 5-phosphate isomerase A
MVEDGQILGVGSGSTAYLALLKIAERVKNEGLHIQAIPTSLEITMACARLGIPVTGLDGHRPDWTFDGADEIDPGLSLIKGRGGAMFKEKLLISSSPKTFIIADSSKMVSRLGMNFPVPIEIFPQAFTYVGHALKKLSPREINLRMAEGKDGPIITENGNLILDVWFDSIPDTTERDIKQITGVIESGLFMGYTIEILNP